MHRRMIALVSALAVLVAFNVAMAKESRPDATIKLTGGSVAAGVGVNWGHGTLIYKGKHYPISVTGLDVGNVGIANMSATGKVYDLKKLADFTGTYAAVGAGVAVGGGGGALAMRNQNGVKIDFVSTSRGVKLALEASGVNMKFNSAQ